MPFFESSDSLGTRMRPLWDKGVVDLRSSPVLEKPLVGAGGAIGGVVGTAWSVPKTVGVAAFEYYDKSLGKGRGRNFFDYVTSSPILHTLAFAGLASVVGAGLAASGVSLPPEWGISSSFQAGVVAYLFSYVSRTFPQVVSAVAAGVTGQGLSTGREFVDWFKRPLGDQRESAWRVAGDAARTKSSLSEVD